MENPFRPDTALSAEVDRLLRSSRIVVEGDRIVMKINEDGSDACDGQKDTKRTNVQTNGTPAQHKSEEAVQASKVVSVEAGVKANGGAQSGVVESSNGGAVHVQASQVEIVQVGSKKHACCTVM